jgi:hypothetical protein
MAIREMIATHPDAKGSIDEALAGCVEACLACAPVCLSCADACLAEDGIERLRRCIRLDLDCADVCEATGRVALRRTGSDGETVRRLLAACETACRLCAEECERHAGMHDHCRICAATCRRCEQVCRTALAGMAG